MSSLSFREEEQLSMDLNFDFEFRTSDFGLELRDVRPKPVFEEPGTESRPPSALPCRSWGGGGGGGESWGGGGGYGGQQQDEPLRQRAPQRHLAAKAAANAQPDVTKCSLNLADLALHLLVRLEDIDSRCGIRPGGACSVVVVRMGASQLFMHLQLRMRFSSVFHCTTRTFLTDIVCSLDLLVQSAFTRA